MRTAWCQLHFRLWLKDCRRTESTFSKFVCEGFAMSAAGSVPIIYGEQTRRSKSMRLPVKVTDPQLGTVERRTLRLEDLGAEVVTEADWSELYFGRWKDVCFCHGICAEDANFASEMVLRVGQQKFAGMESDAVLGATAASLRSGGKVASLTGIMWICRDLHPDPWNLLRMCVAEDKSNRKDGASDAFVKALTECHRAWRPEKHICAGCATVCFVEKLQKCKGCKVVHYCQRTCQKRHWPVHKEVCDLLRSRVAQERKLRSEDPCKVLCASDKILCIQKKLKSHKGTRAYNPFEEESESAE